MRQEKTPKTQAKQMGITEKAKTENNKEVALTKTNDL